MKLYISDPQKLCLQLGGSTFVAFSKHMTITLSAGNPFHAWVWTALHSTCRFHRCCKQLCLQNASDQLLVTDSISLGSVCPLLHGSASWAAQAFQETYRNLYEHFLPCGTKNMCRRLSKNARRLSWVNSSDPFMLSDTPTGTWAARCENKLTMSLSPGAAMVCEIFSMRVVKDPRASACFCQWSAHWLPFAFGVSRTDGAPWQLLPEKLRHMQPSCDSKIEFAQK